MLDFAECPCSGGTLDRLIQPSILVILAEGPLHGYRIAERIGEMPSCCGPKPDVSGIYRFLKAMEAKELVIGQWDHSESGPAKKCYQITPAGQRCLRQWVDTLDEYHQRISDLLQAARRTMR